MTISVSQMEILKFAVLGLMAVVLAAFAAPLPAKAATTSYIPQTQRELISYMQGIVDTLQAQVGTSGTTGGAGSSRVETGAADVAVATKVELKASFDAGNSSTVYAWFEYGEGNSLNKKTARTRVTKVRGEVEYEVTLSGLKTGVMYSYRPVFELSSGSKYYGAVRTFGTNTLVSGVIIDGNSGSQNTGRGSVRSESTRYDAYERFAVTYTVAKSQVGTNVRIGLYNIGATNDDALQIHAIGDDTSGSKSFKVREAGSYEIRLIQDGTTVPMATKRITIK